MVDINVISKAQDHYKNYKNKAKTLYLSLWLLRIFLGVNLRLGLNSFSLGNHIPNCKGVFGGVGISFILCLFLPLLLLFHFLLCPRGHHCPILLFFSPCWCLCILRRLLSGERLLRGRKRKDDRRRRSCCAFSKVLWVVYLVHSPQIGVRRDSCPIKGLIVHFGTVLPTDHDHFSS